MKFFRFLLAPACLLALSAHATDIKGAGSSAAAPLYQKWADAYAKKGTATIDYQASGSSAGIKKIKENSVDFGASDVALPAADLKKSHLIQFPSAVSGVVIVVNLPGYKASEVRMNGELLSAIFAGHITQWNDPALAALNPSLHLPAKPIDVIVRQDGSGTTYNLTDYLSRVSKEWQSAFGKNFTIAWNSRLTQVKGSSAISAAIRKTPYSIGYIDYNYVVQDKLDAVLLQNHDGKFLLPTAETFSAALNNSGWKTQANFEEMLTDKAGLKSWPITMGTFIILPQAAANPEKMTSTLKFLTWAFMNGDHLVNSVDFVRLPDALQARAFKEMMTVTDSKGVPLNWSMQQ